MPTPWQPGVGALMDPAGVRFRVWAPDARSIELVTEDGQSFPLTRQPDGVHELFHPHASAGFLYRYRVDGNGPFPDPASRYQPQGVHGPSQVIDPTHFAWTDHAWQGPDPDRLVIYELHVGTFTPEGTFAAAAERLADLKKLGITAVELMPVADFPGERGWGYDGVSLYAPARCYGTPDDLRQLIDTAHRLGLAVLLDVVYNHLGPDGNYLGVYSSHYFSKIHETPWGSGPNFDGERSEGAVQFFIENTLSWIHDYHIDGVRLDATHAILDDSSPSFLARLTEAAHAAGEQLGRRVIVIAEDERNFAPLVTATSQKGLGMDGVWADDFHHQMRRALAGDCDGYFTDYTGSTEDIARTLTQGWFYTGQRSDHHQATRGTATQGIPPERFVLCIQNHDQIGNRAFGERLHQQIDPSAYRAASALLLLAPQTPLLYMGQEWACTTPFLYFSHHHEELGKLVTAGRRNEFRHFRLFADPHVRDRIPDPQAETTFQASKLNWAEREQPYHQGVWQLYQDLLALRQSEPALQPGGQFEVGAVNDRTLSLTRTSPNGPHTLQVVVALKPGTVAVLPEPHWEIALTTEDPKFTPFSRMPKITRDATSMVIHFPCPAAVVLRSTSARR